MRLGNIRTTGSLAAGLVVVLLALASAGCSTMTIKTDFDSDVDFAKYKTYKWYRPTPGAEAARVNSLLDKRIKLAVERELTAKGLERSQGRGADLIIRYHAGMRERVEITSDWYGWRYRRRSIDTYRYREGTIVIDFVDPQLKQLVWRGWAVGVMDDPGNAAAMINEAVGKILQRYPPQ
jgi:hypothetical protein